MISVQFIYAEEDLPFVEELEARLWAAGVLEGVGRSRLPLSVQSPIPNTAFANGGTGVGLLRVILVSSRLRPRQTGLDAALSHVIQLGPRPDRLLRTVIIEPLGEELNPVEGWHNLGVFEPVPDPPLSEADSAEAAWAEVVEAVKSDLGHLLPGRVERFALRGFTSFDDATLELCDGVNVFIGENSTGKTHALKAMYAIVRANEDASGADVGRPQRIPDLDSSFAQKVIAVFRPDGGLVHRLVRTGSDHARLEYAVGGQSGALRLHGSAARWPPVDSFNTRGAVFIPSREVLAMYEGFIPLYKRFQLSFDETYYDLCEALTLPLLVQPLDAEVLPLVESLEAIIGGRVQLRGSRFYVVRFSDGYEVEAHLLAEGHRKLATLVHLLRNGSLQPGGLLFWDEPEANLNPQLIPQLVEALLALADAGIQVFLATHDYLLSYRLSLAAEYRTSPQVPTRFFSFFRPEPSAAVEVEWAETLSGLEHNPILDSFAALYDFEAALFNKGAGEE